MIVRRFFIFAFFASLALSFSCLILKTRQDSGVFLAKDLFDQIREESRLFLSDYLWSKVDTYGHFGEWIKKDVDGREEYFSVFHAQQEVQSLSRLSIKMNRASQDRVCTVAYGLAKNHGLFDEAHSLLIRSAIDYPDQEKVYRYYGELGVLYFQVKKDPLTAMRFLKRSLELVQRVDPKHYDFHDYFNLKIYSFHASLISYQVGDLSQAYKYHKMAFFEPGDEDYNLAMAYMVKESKEEHLKETARARYMQLLKAHDKEHDHDHLLEESGYKRMGDHKNGTGHTSHHQHEEYESKDHNGHEAHDHGKQKEIHHEDHMADSENHHQAHHEHDHSAVEHAQESAHSKDHTQDIPAEKKEMIGGKVSRLQLKEREAHRGNLSREEMIELNNQLKEVYIYLIPKVNQAFYSRISKKSALGYSILALFLWLIFLFRIRSGTFKP